MFNVLLLSKPWPLPGALSGRQLCDNEGSLVDLQIVCRESNKIRLLLPGALHPSEYSAGCRWQNEQREDLLSQISWWIQDSILVLTKSCPSHKQEELSLSARDLSEAPMNINPSLSKIPFFACYWASTATFRVYSCQLSFILPETALAAWSEGDSLRGEALLNGFLQFCILPSVCHTNSSLWLQQFASPFFFFFFFNEFHSPAPTWEVLFSSARRRCTAMCGSYSRSFPVPLGWASNDSKGAVEGASKPFWVRFVSVVQCLIPPKEHLSSPAAGHGVPKNQVWGNGAWPPPSPFYSIWERKKLFLRLYLMPSLFHP